MARSTSSPVAASDTPVSGIRSDRFALSSSSSRCARAQWTKNLLRVRRSALRHAPVRCRRRCREAMAAFVIFCALSGVVYLVNDISRSRQRSASSAQGETSDRVGRAAACRRPPWRGRRRGVVAARGRAARSAGRSRSSRRPILRCRRSIRLAQARRDHRRADDRRSASCCAPSAAPWPSTSNSATGCSCAQSSWRCSSR